MNHEQWEDLQAATLRHTPGPWLVYWKDWTDQHEHKLDGIGPIRHDNPCHDDDSWVHAIPPDARLAAAAPALLAEVERLRGWMTWLLDADDYNAADACREMCQDALNGEEVPK